MTTASPAPKPNPRGWLARWGLRLLGPVLLVVVVARLDEPEAILTTLSAADPLLLGVVFSLTLLLVHMRVVRWRWLLRRRSIDYPMKHAWLAYLGSSYVAVLTPGRVGDVVRVQYLRHDRNVPVAEGLASVVMDRLFDIYVLGVFVAYGTLRFAPVLHGQLGYVAWAGLAAILLGPAVLFVPGVADKPLRRLASVVSKEHGAAESERFLQAIRAHLHVESIPVVALTAASFALNYFQGYLLAKALGLDIPMLDIVGLLAIQTLLGLLPISVSGLGVRELFFSLAFPMLRLEPAQGVAFGLLVFVAFNLLLVVLGLISFQVAPPPVRADAPPKQSRESTE